MANLAIHPSLTRNVAGPITDIVKTNFAVSDEYRGSSLEGRSVDHVCPTLIWQLGDSAAHYRPLGR